MLNFYSYQYVVFILNINYNTLKISADKNFKKIIFISCIFFKNKVILQP